MILLDLRMCVFGICVRRDEILEKINFEGRRKKRRQKCCFFVKSVIFTIDGQLFSCIRYNGYPAVRKTILFKEYIQSPARRNGIIGQNYTGNVQDGVSKIHNELVRMNKKKQLTRKP